MTAIHTEDQARASLDDFFNQKHPKTTTVSMRFSDEDMSVFEWAASRWAMRVADFCRSAAVVAARRVIVGMPQANHRNVTLEDKEVIEFIERQQQQGKVAIWIDSKVSGQARKILSTKGLL